MIMCWAAVYLIAVVVAVSKKRWVGLRYVLAGAAIVAAGIGASIVLNNEIGAILLSIALLSAAYVTLKGIIAILAKP